MARACFEQTVRAKETYCNVVHVSIRVCVYQARTQEGVSGVQTHPKMFVVCTVIYLFNFNGILYSNRHVQHYICGTPVEAK